MTYKYFNSSLLAFGVNITNAFKSLGKKLDDAYINLDIAKLILQYNNTYNNKNYIVPEPTHPEDPCRSLELFKVLTVCPMLIKDISYSEGVFSVDVLMFNTNNYKLTHLSGSRNVTNIDNPKGYVCYTETTNNNNPNKSITFVSEEAYNKDTNTRKALFRYVIEKEDGIINIDKISNVGFPVYPSCYSGHYKDIELEQVEDGTATGYQALIGITQLASKDHQIALVDDEENESLIQRQNFPYNTDHQLRVGGVAYCFPTEQLKITKGTGNIYKIKYISGMRGKVNE